MTQVWYDTQKKAIPVQGSVAQIAVVEAAPKKAQAAQKKAAEEVAYTLALAK